MRHFGEGAGSQAVWRGAGSTSPVELGWAATREEQARGDKAASVCRRVACFWHDAHSSDVSTFGAGDMGLGRPLVTARWEEGAPARPADLRAHSHCVPRSRGCVPAGPAAFKCLFPPSSTHFAAGATGQPGSVSEPGLRYKALSPA